MSFSTTSRTVLLLSGLAACAPATPPAGVASATGPAMATPAVAASSSSGRRAHACNIQGFSWTGRETSVSPTLTASSDGSCTRTVRNYNSTPMPMTIVSQPSHGTLTTSGAAMQPSFTYTAVPGYEGSDSFVLATGRGGAITATVAVNVTR